MRKGTFLRNCWNVTGRWKNFAILSSLLDLIKTRSCSPISGYIFDDVRCCPTPLSAVPIDQLTEVVSAGRSPDHLV